MCTQVRPEATEAMTTLDSTETIPTDEIGVKLYVGRDVTGDYMGFVDKPELHSTGIWDAEGFCERFILPDGVYPKLPKRGICEIKLTAERLPDEPGWEWSAEEGR